MSAGWNAKPTEREQARLMWDAGLPRKRIAALLGISHHTVSKWRWQDGWTNRRRYEDRPIVHHARQTFRGPAHLRRGPGNTRRTGAPAPEALYRCACGGRATSPQGHDRCRPSGTSDISGNQEAA